MISRFWIPLIPGIFLISCADMRTAEQAAQRADYRTAQAHYKELADFGIPEAKLELGLLYGKGRGIPQDSKKAVQLFQEAADAGNDRALFELARFYEETDRAKAKALYFKALEKGYARSYAGLAGIAEDENDFEGAETLYRQALAGGYSKAAEKIGSLYEKGKGRPKDSVTALAWYYFAQAQDVDGQEDNVQRLESNLSKEQVAKARKLSLGLGL